MFAYGANTNMKSMANRCPGAICLGPAWLDGYAFRWRRFADIELAAEDDYVIGLLWEIDDIHLASLDDYEGFPDHYFRQRVKIQTRNRVYTGWAYMMVEQGKESLPHEEYKAALFEGYAENDISTDQMELGFKRIKV
jgi:gamma-glutamylcyclotransferase (GGCT)/AIG2-like uncharacterized protein YtfP